jgi:hypothetical protein
MIIRSEESFIAYYVNIEKVLLYQNVFAYLHLKSIVVVNSFNHFIFYVLSIIWWMNNKSFKKETKKCFKKETKKCFKK